METNVVVLVVEDDVSIHLLLKDALEEAQFEVLSASGADEAIAKLDANDGAIRALVTDIDLGKPKLTGWDVAMHARGINAELAVVYMTGASANDWAARGVPKSILVTKPFVPAQVITAISQLLNAGNTPGA